jgi:hypothetical protein
VSKNRFSVDPKLTKIQLLQILQTISHIYCGEIFAGRIFARFKSCGSSMESNKRENISPISLADWAEMTQKVWMK